MPLIALLCAINSQFIHSNPAVHSLKNYCERQAEISHRPCGFLKIEEFTMNDTLDAILYGILAHKPDIIALSTYIWNIERVTRLCKLLRTLLPSGKIILGGPEVSYGIDHTDLSIDDYDYLIIGEGEKTFFELIAMLNSGNPRHSWLYGGDPNNKTLQASQLEDLAEIPFIYDSNNLSLFHNRILYYETSRGCPFQCCFCLSGGNDPLRVLPIDRVKQDIDFFIQARVKQVKFVDRTFNCMPDRAFAIWEHILLHQENIQTNFHFEVGADLFTDAQLSLLRQAERGVIQLEIGIQSMREETLHACSRKVQLDKCADVIRQIVQMGNIHVHLDLIAGLPLESYSQFQSSFNLTYAMGAHQLQLGFLKLLQGAPLKRDIDRYAYRFSPFPPYEVLSHALLSYQEIQQLKCVEDVLDRYYNSARFRLTLDFLLLFFPSPFALYEALAAYWQSHGLIFRAMSAARLIETLHAFIIQLNIPSDASRQARALLLLDYFASDQSDSPPSCLVDIWTPYRAYRDTAQRWLATRDDIASSRPVVRQVDDALYLLDYSGKNPVALRFDILDTIPLEKLHSVLKPIL